MVALDQLPCALWTVADHTVVLTLQWGEILPEHDQEKCVLLYEALSLGPVNWAELRENLSEQLAVHEKGDLVHDEKVLLGAPCEGTPWSTSPCEGGPGFRGLIQGRSDVLNQIFYHKYLHIKPRETLSLALSIPQITGVLNRDCFEDHTINLKSHSGKMLSMCRQTHQGPIKGGGRLH